jgi:hypothetical protein
MTVTAAMAMAVRVHLLFAVVVAPGKDLHLLVGAHDVHRTAQARIVCDTPGHASPPNDRGAKLLAWGM